MPWFGGKHRWGNEVWKKFGDPEIYVEPFCGSYAVGLFRPTPCAREILCDTDGFICNLFRAIRRDPDGVAYHADYPTIHQDLLARRYWLHRWGKVNRQRVTEDINYFDIKAAGYWVWCVSQWIGMLTDMLDPKGGAPDDKETVLRDQIPNAIASPVGGRGVQRQKRFGQLRDQIPYTNSPSGRGTQRQRASFHNGSTGASAFPDGSHLRSWFAAIAARLANAIVLNRSWESAVTDTMLCRTKSSQNATVAVFLDPPYVVGDDQKVAYSADGKIEDVNEVARQSYQWAVAHGDEYRIAYCSAADDFPLPEGWTVMDKSMGGVRKKYRARVRDQVMFSPACVKDDQIGMFGDDF